MNEWKSIIMLYRLYKTTTHVLVYKVGRKTYVLSCTSQCKPPHPLGRNIAGHLRGIFRYLTSERAAGIEDFDLFCTSSKNSGGVDRGIFHRGGLGQESLVQQDGGFWPWKEGKSRFTLITLYLWLSMPSVLNIRSLYNAKNTYNWLFCEQKSFVTVIARNLFWKPLDRSSMSSGIYILFLCIFTWIGLYTDRSELKSCIVRDSATKLLFIGANFV